MGVYSIGWQKDKIYIINKIDCKVNAEIVVTSSSIIQDKSWPEDIYI